MQLDLAVAQDNIAKALEEARQNVARLEATQSLIASQGDGIIELVGVISQFSRKRREARQPGDPTTLLPKNANASDVIRAILLTAPAPMRAESIVLHTLGQTHKLTRAKVTGALIRMEAGGEIKKMGRGLYSKPAGAKGNGIVQALTDLPTTKGKLGKKAAYDASMTALVPLVRAAIQADKKILSGDLTERLEKDGFAFAGKNHQTMVRSAVASLGKAVKLTGQGRWTSYVWKG